MRVNLTIDVSSRDGETLRREFEFYRDILEFECACPADRTCEVSIEEGGRGGYDVIVTRSGYSLAPTEWFVAHGKQECRYIRTFRNDSAEAMAAAIVELIEKPLLLLL